MNFQDLSEEEIEELKELGFHFHTHKKEQKAKGIERKTKKSVKYGEDEGDEN